jgi:HTH-type transcriptional regulator / antitoxin HigA
MERTTVKTVDSLPKKVLLSYEDLVRMHVPRKIHDDVEHQRVLRIVQWLAVRVENDDQEDYLALMSDLVYEYEQATLRPLPKTSGRKMLKSLCREHRINTRQLGEVLGVDQSVAARILSGERSITVEHAKKLGTRFHVMPSLFLDI